MNSRSSLDIIPVLFLTECPCHSPLPVATMPWQLQATNAVQLEDYVFLLLVFADLPNLCVLVLLLLTFTVDGVLELVMEFGLLES